MNPVMGVAGLVTGMLLLLAVSAAAGRVAGRPAASASRPVPVRPGPRFRVAGAVEAPYTPWAALDGRRGQRPDRTPPPAGS